MLESSVSQFRKGARSRPSMQDPVPWQLREHEHWQTLTNSSHHGPKAEVTGKDLAVTGLPLARPRSQLTPSHGSECQSSGSE